MDCKKCGHCCRSLIIEIEQLDVVREPKLLKTTKLLNVDLHRESEWDKEYLLACGPTLLCPFQVENKCTIYPTRPNICVGFEVGSEQCKFAEQTVHPETSDE